MANHRLETLQHAIERYYSVHEMAYEDCPAHFFIGIPTAQAPTVLRDPPKLATGRGFTLDEARGGCLGEIAEALCLCQPEDIAVRQARALELDDRVLLPDQLAQYGTQQLADRGRWNTRYAEHAWIPEPFNASQLIDWVKARSLAGEVMYVPAACCYLDHFKASSNTRFAVADSNGCAVAWSLEEAVLRGFLELVERDATGIWWYGMHRRPSVNIERIEDPRLQQIRTWHQNTERSLTVLDLTTDFAIPVCVAVSADKKGGNVALGFAAALNMGRAVSAACAEMLQLELSMNLIVQTRRNGAARETSETKMLDTWRQLVSLSRAPQLVAAHGELSKPVTTLVPEASPTETLAWCERQCQRMGLSMWVLDLSRPEFPVRAARVIVPGLCHYKARLGVRRLYDVPQALGWCSHLRGEEQLNKVPLLI